MSTNQNTELLKQEKKHHEKAENHARMAKDSDNTIGDRLSHGATAAKEKIAEGVTHVENVITEPYSRERERERARESGVDISEFDLLRREPYPLPSSLPLAATTSSLSSTSSSSSTTLKSTDPPMTIDNSSITDPEKVHKSTAHWEMAKDGTKPITERAINAGTAVKEKVSEVLASNPNSDAHMTISPRSRGFPPTGAGGPGKEWC